MAEPKTSLLTPIYIKPRPDTAWPDDPVFYILTGKGLFLCRNHEFFQSSVAAPRWPAELAPHEAFLAVRYPKVPRRVLERVVGFFDRVAEVHGSEAAVLLAFDRRTRRVEAVVPDQTATVSRSGWGGVWPIGVEYQVPAGLPPELVVIGDVHSHVESAAYASYVDKHDETHRAGLHVVVGRIHLEPPELHIEAVTDGVRFKVEEELVLEGYRERRFDFPEEWMGRIKVETYGKKRHNDYGGCDKHSGGTAGTAGTSGGQTQYNKYGSYHVEPADPYGDFAAGRAHGGGAACDAGEKPAGPAGQATPDKELLDDLAVERLDRDTAEDVPPGPWKLKPETTPLLGYEA